MNAKEMAEYNKETFYKLTGGFKYQYRFTPKEFKQFCDQLCKEQRENVLKACNFDSDYTYYFANDGEILNAKMPEL
jgi:hypothetical protein